MHAGEQCIVDGQLNPKYSAGHNITDMHNVTDDDIILVEFLLEALYKLPEQKISILDSLYVKS